MKIKKQDFPLATRSSWNQVLPSFFDFWCFCECFATVPCRNHIHLQMLHTDLHYCRSISFYVPVMRCRSFRYIYIYIYISNHNGKFIYQPCPPSDMGSLSRAWIVSIELSMLTSSYLWFGWQLYMDISLSVYLIADIYELIYLSVVWLGF